MPKGDRRRELYGTDVGIMLAGVDETCCVAKSTHLEKKGDLELADDCQLEWLERNASRVPLEKFKQKDGLFVF